MACESWCGFSVASSHFEGGKAGMPRSKTKRKARSSGGRSMTWGGPSGARDRRWNFVILAGIVLAAMYGAYAWWASDRIEHAFMARAAEGEGALGRVESIPSAGPHASRSRPDLRVPKIAFRPRVRMIRHGRRP